MITWAVCWFLSLLLNRVERFNLDFAANMILAAILGDVVILIFFTVALAVKYKAKQ